MAKRPSAQARSEAFAAGPVDAEAERLMQEAIAERLPEIVLEPVANYLLPVQDGIIPIIEQTSKSLLRSLWPAAHVER